MKGVVGLLLALSSTLAYSQNSSGVVPQFIGVWDKDATLMCDRVPHQEQSALGLAHALLDSLSYSRDAANRSKEIPGALSAAQDMTGLMTELLRISKSSSNDYRCAEVPLGAFNQPATDATKRLIAQSAIFSLHQQIQLDDRLNAFTKKLGTLSQAEMADEMSSMQVERDKIWHSLVPVIEVVLLSLEDDKRLNKNGNIDRLNITLAQKQALAGKVVRLFPGAAGDDPDHMNMPTFLASLYLVLLNGHKAADEA